MARDSGRNPQVDPAHTADQILAGVRSLREVFDSLWTLLEDLEFWQLPASRSWRSVRPDRRDALTATAGLLPRESQRELVELLLECHGAYRDLLVERKRIEQLEDDQGWNPPWQTGDTRLERFAARLDSGDYYNPFCDDLCLAAELVERLAIPFDPARTAGLARLAKALELQRFPVRDLRAPHHDDAYQERVRRSHRFDALSSFRSSPRDDETRAGIHRRLDDPGCAFRHEAPRALVALDGEGALPSLVRLCWNRGDPALGTVVFELGELRKQDPGAIAALIECVRDAGQRDPDNRWRAVVALGKIASPAAAQAVVEYASTWGARENHRAVEALGWIGGPVAEDFLVFLVQNDATHPWWKELAIVALGRMRSDRGVEAIRREIDRRVGHERFGYELGATALANIGTLRARALLRDGGLYGGIHLFQALHHVHGQMKERAQTA